MLTYIITGDTVSIDSAVRAYIEKRLADLERFTGKNAVEELHVIVSKTTAHNREDSYKIEAKFTLYKRSFFASTEKNDVREAVDIVRSELVQEVSRSNQRRRALFHRGARALKAIATGVQRGGRQLRKPRTKSE